MMMKSGKLFLYGMVYQILDHHLGLTKMPYNVKLEVQSNITDVDVANQSLGFPKF